MEDKDTIYIISEFEQTEGWDSNTQLLLLADFIDENNLQKDLRGFLQTRTHNPNEDKE